MAKEIKYVFDVHTLSVQEDRRGRMDILKTAIRYILFVIVMFGLALVVVFYFIDSPKERKMERDLRQAQHQYQSLNHRVDMLTEVLKDIQNRDANLYRVVFEADPPENFQRLLDMGVYDQFAGNGSVDMIINTSEKVAVLTLQMYQQSKSIDSLHKMAETKEERLKHIPAILPVNQVNANLYSGFGMRLHPIFKESRMHTGIDFTGPKGALIYATGDGTVEEVGYVPSYGGYGIMVMINHGYGYQSLYAHCSKTVVRRGQRVKRGDLIAYMGATGQATGTHLHYEVIVKGIKVNPVYYIFDNVTPEEYSRLLEKSQEFNQSLS
ncbi:peptidase M23 [Bacteroidia bacterium]|nr:peptidase M23 [Bacteroidia bacterium]